MNEKVMVAVSGGPDSMFLLDKLRIENNFSLNVLHINYHLRVSSNRDQEILSNYCKKYNLNLIIKNIKKDDWKKAPIKNKEAAARWIRYEFFNEESKKINTNTLYMAHHLDDWIETAIMQEEKSDRYLYYGIKTISEYKNLIIKRPLIEKKMFKEDLIQYLIKNSIEYGLDETNEFLIFTRNKIRANLLGTSKKRKIKIIKHYNKINKAKQSLRRKINNLYFDWNKNNFSWPFFNKVHEKYKEDLVYYFLTKNNEFINVSSNKLIAILNFLKSPASNREFVLMENLKLTVFNGTIKIIKISNEDRK